MNLFRKYKTYWVVGIIIVCAILFITNFHAVLNGIGVLFSAIAPLLIGAMLAFVLNLIMEPVENWLLKSKKPFIQKHARALALLTAVFSALLVISLILAIVIPNMVQAIQVLTKEAPSVFRELEQFTQHLLDRFPSLQEQVSKLNINWETILKSVMGFLGGGGLNGSIQMVSGAVSGAVNTFVIVIFAIYVLSDKERFIRLYHFFTELYLSDKSSAHLKKDLEIINSCFTSFVAGELIEACILTAMCAVGMFILRLPYALMISILVGVINMIPMVGAFIGGGIGALIIFTISPVKCLIFIVFLCIIQQIESNIFFPRIIGNKVGLPGIYVMITIVVGGSLFGILGMILGVPFMAAVYKISRAYFQEKMAEKMKNNPALEPVSLPDE